VWVWDSRTGETVFPLPAAPEEAPYHPLAFSPDGRYLLTQKDGRAVQVWDAATSDAVGLLDTDIRSMRALVFSRDGAQLASVSTDGIVKLWDATRLNEKQEARLTFRARVPGPGVNVAFSPDGRRLATGSEENTVKIRDVATGRELKKLEGHKGEV